MKMFDPVKDIASRIERVRPDLNVGNIIAHLERAFALFTVGIETGDEQNFTDVIYRCNQAFEGCSRQAFLILADKNNDILRKTPAWKIEKYLKEEDVLNERVFPLFTNYREKWRNESAHDFNLFFKEEEAYVAILSIYSYAYVLLNQIILKISAVNDDIDYSNTNKLKKQRLDQEIISLTKQFVSKVDFRNYISGSSIKNINEREFLGIYSSFLNNNLEKSNLLVDGVIGKDRKKRIDLMVVKGEEKVIIEVKSISMRGAVDEILKNQMASYLSEFPDSRGIVFFYDNSGNMDSLTVKSLKVAKGKEQHWISLLETSQKE